MQNRHNFDIALRELKLKLLRMGGDVQEALRNSVESLRTMDQGLAQDVIDNDGKINRQEHEIEDMCIRLIATQQPVATDLRKIVAGLRIASDLERIADYAVDVAKSTRRLSGQTLIKPLIDIPRVAVVVDQMISDALNSYVENNVDLAAKLATEDDEVDQIHKAILSDLFTITADKPEALQQAITLAHVNRCLERVGDHATNIGESVIYIVSGERSDLN